MVSADPSEVGRIDIRFGLRPLFRSASDLKSDLVEALRRQGMAGVPSAFPRERRGTGPCPDEQPLGPSRRSGPGPGRERSGHKKPRNSAGLDDSMPDPTSSSMMVAMGGLEP